jgi:hypothetical protein
VELSTGYGGKIYDLTFYDGETRTLVLLATSTHTDVLDDLSIICKNPSSSGFCDYVTYNPGSFDLGSLEVLQIKMTIALPDSFDYGDGIDFESELSYHGSDNSLLSDKVRTNILVSKSSYLRAWGSNFFRSYDFGVPIPKILVWLLFSSFVGFMIGLLATKDQTKRTIIGVWVFFVLFMSLSIGEGFIVDFVNGLF